MLSFGAMMDRREEGKQLIAFVQFCFELLSGQPSHFHHDFQPVLSLARFFFTDGNTVSKVRTADSPVRFSIIRSYRCSRSDDLTRNRIRFSIMRQAGSKLDDSYSKCLRPILQLLTKFFIGCHRLFLTLRNEILYDLDSTHTDYFSHFQICNLAIFTLHFSHFYMRSL